MLLVRPPGPQPVTRSPFSLFKSARIMSRDPAQAIADRFERYGDLYYLEFFGRSVYVTRKPELIQQILITRGDKFEKPSQGLIARNLRRLLGDGLLLSNGELWRRQRRMIQPAFRRERIDQYARLVIALAEQFALELRDAEELDVSHAMMELTLHIVSRALFDHDEAADRERVARATRAFRAASGGVQALLPRALPTPRNRRIQRALDDLDALIYGLMDARSGGEKRLDLLSALANAVDREGDGQGMERTLIRDELITLLLAGHETTSHALSWTFYLLSQHPEIEARVRAEVESVLGTRTPEPSDVDKLVYTEQVLNEAMRLYPPAYSLARTCREQTELDGYTIPAGSDVIVWIYHAHRDARWFPEPLRFDPERFSAARRASLVPGSYLPFGLGTRTCIGKHFALMEAKLVLACTLRRVSLHDLARTPVARDMAVTLAPRGGLPMRVSLHHG